MRGTVAKRLRREARALTEGLIPEATKKKYRELKKKFKKQLDK